MDDARSGQKLVPGHLGMKKSGRPFGGHDQFRGTWKWSRNVFGQRDERGYPCQNCSMSLVRITRVEGHIMVRTRSVIQERTAHLLVQLPRDLRLPGIDRMHVPIEAVRHSRRIRQDHCTGLSPLL